MRIGVRCTKDERHYWNAEAHANGHTLTSWTRQLLRLAIVTKPEKPKSDTASDHSNDIRLHRLRYHLEEAERLAKLLRIDLTLPSV